MKARERVRLSLSSYRGTHVKSFAMAASYTWVKENYSPTHLAALTPPRVTLARRILQTRCLSVGSIYCCKTTVIHPLNHDLELRGATVHRTVPAERNHFRQPYLTCWLAHARDEDGYSLLRKVHFFHASQVEKYLLLLAGYAAQ